MTQTVEFRLREEGHLPVVTSSSSTSSHTATGAAFQRFRAVLPASKGEKTKGASIQEWTRAMLSSDAVLQSFLEILKNNPYQAFFFETRPVTALRMASKTFEFVLVDAPELYQFATSRPDPTAFAEYFHHRCNNACVFTSLNKDATLVAPKPPSTDEDGTVTDLVTFSHLADFCRKANYDLVSSTWRLAIQTYVKQLERQSIRSLWFSTSGLGVAWLHFRVDQRPKYYTYPNFRDEK